MSPSPTYTKYNFTMPALGNELPIRHKRFTQWLGIHVFKLFGWKIKGEIPNLPKAILIGAPHTSNLDFIWTIWTMFALDLQFSWVAKKEMFFWPFRRTLISLGGVPLDRQKTVGFVEQMAEEFRRREKFVLAIMPEGTRSVVEGWKTGFYYLAVASKLPVVLITFNFGLKEMKIGPSIQPTGDYEKDLHHIQSYYKGVKGKNPEKQLDFY